MKTSEPAQKRNENGGLLAVYNGVIRFVSLGYLPSPVIMPSAGVSIYVNGVLLRHPVEVTKSDRLELVPHKQVMRNASMHTSVSADKMSAYLHISPQVTKVYRIPNQAPQRQLNIRTEETIELVLPYTVDDVFTLLKEKGITFGILDDAIHGRISLAEEGNVLIARGTEPVDGTDDTVEEYFAHLVERYQYTENDDRIDFRNHQVIPQVEKGDLVAQTHPGQPAKPGCNVFGEEIPARPAEKITLQAKKGVKIVNGTQVFAADRGRPLVEGGKIRFYSVVKCHYHNEDVTIKTGNIRFAGDLVINGNVHESMCVTATGSVTVNGNIYNATIQAGHKVTIKGTAVGSAITAFRGAAAYQKAAAVMSKLNSQVSGLLHKLFFFQERTGITDPGKLGKAVLLILENDFPEMTESVRDVELLLEKEIKPYLEIPDIVVEAMEKLHNGLIRLRNCPSCSVGDVAEFVKGAGLLADYFKKEHVPRADIVLGNVLRCQVQTTGNVTVTAEECFHTDITADGIAAYCIVRGGSLSAKGNIFAREVGSSFGVETTLRVPRDKRITLGHVYENTVVYIGEGKLRFNVQKRNIVLRVRDGRIEDVPGKRIAAK